MKKIWFVAKLSGDNSEYTGLMAEFPRIHLNRESAISLTTCQEQEEVAE